MFKLNQRAKRFRTANKRKINAIDAVQWTILNYVAGITVWKILIGNIAYIKQVHNEHKMFVPHKSS